MPISIGCDDCGKQLTIHDRYAGKRIKCPKCETVIAVPADDEDDRPAPRKRDGEREAIAEKPRGKTSPDRHEEVADRPARKGASKGDRDDFDDEPIVKSKKKPKKGGGLWLWLGLGGGGAVLLLGTCLCGGVLYSLGLLPFGGGVSAESKYFPSDVEFVSSDRVDQLRKTRLHEAQKAKIGKLIEGGRFGLKEEEIDRSTTANAGTDSVTIITANKSLKPEEIKEGMGKSPLGNVKVEFSEEKVGSHVLYVAKGLGPTSFCIPESKILLVGSAATLRKILERGKTPEMSENFKKAYSAADFSNARVSVSGSKKAGGGLIGIGSKVKPEASLLQVSYGSNITTKQVYYFKDSADAEEARKEAEESLQKEPIINSEMIKEMRKNASISKFGSTLTLSTYVREQTMIDEMN